MKRIKLFVFALLLGSTVFSYAQSPYSMGVGAAVGNVFGPSFKVFVTDNFAISADLSVRVCPTIYEGVSLTTFSLDLNPNFMYESSITNNLYWLAGGGVTLGYIFGLAAYGDMMIGNSGRFGINANGGIEYKFDIPLAIQADVRPGYGLLFNSGPGVANGFDWAAVATIRYTF